jgi:hypothetical protein
MELIASSVAQHEVDRQPNQRTSKLERFLDTLVTWDFSSILNVETETLSLVSNTAVEARGDGDQGGGSLNDPPALRVFSQLAVLQSLDKSALSLPVSINVAYWKLGEAYEAFVNVGNMYN